MGQQKSKQKTTNMASRIVLGGGCFWCIEAVFQRIKGVQKVQSGYAAGHIKNPTYQQICTGKTGHAQVCRIYYDPKTISYPTLLYIFFHIHDPTTLNRQGADTGTQYRSIILVQKGQQQELQMAKTVIKEVTEEGKYPGAPEKIITELKVLEQFYPGEEYHQNYYNQNPNQGYCRAVIKPKIGKFKTLFEKYIDLSRL